MCFRNPPTGRDLNPGPSGFETGKCWIWFKQWFCKRLYHLYRPAGWACLKRQSDLSEKPELETIEFQSPHNAVRVTTVFTVVTLRYTNLEIL